MGELSEADRALLTQAQDAARARAALQQIQETGNSQREAARARMSGRTIDETGKDINERQPEPEPIKPGWYWTGTDTVWVIGTSFTQNTVYHQYKGAGAPVLGWDLATHVHHWQRVHEQVQESGQGFGWRPPGQTH